MICDHRAGSCDLFGRPRRGQTYAMLGEAHSQAGSAARRGRRGRRDTRTQQDRETALGTMIPPRYVEHRGARFPGTRCGGSTATSSSGGAGGRTPHQHTCGSKNPKRWQDVQEILDAGTTVISTVNIQQSLEWPKRCRGKSPASSRRRRSRRRGPRADRIELVDITRKRCGAGLFTATPMAPNGSMPRCRTTSARASDCAARDRVAVVGRPLMS